MASITDRIVAESLTFDDLSLIPQYSEVAPTQADTSTHLWAGTRLSIPILSAAMDTVTGPEMAVAMALAGGIGVLPRNCPVHTQSSWVREVVDTTPATAGTAAFDQWSGAADSSFNGDTNLMVAAAVGVGRAEQDRIAALITAGVSAIVIDSAHGHSKGVIDQVKYAAHNYDVPVAAGNVVTAEGALALAEAGASMIKVGQGPGSVCTTRQVAGIGVGQLTAIYDIAVALDGVLDRFGRPVTVCADGGIHYSGDIVKALAAGADTVMLGGLLAGCSEAPGVWATVEGVTKRVFRGMGSAAVMTTNNFSKDRYGQVGVAADKVVPEGVETTVADSGPVAQTLHQLVGGLRSGMGYCGAATISELQAKARWVRCTQAAIAEGRPHLLGRA